MQVMTILAAVGMAACNDNSTAPVPQDNRPTATLVTATGDISATVDAFRASLGTANGGTAGEQVGGRREINWDGVGANPFDNRNDFPPDFFNTTVKSGAVFTTDGTGFRNDSTSFVGINPSYAAQFAFFSASKIFSPIGSNLLDVLFRVAGQPTPATVRGFGIVLSDVDLPNKTTIELFDQNGAPLGSFPAPLRSNAQGLSFVGVTFDQAIIARVRITLGTGALGATTDDVTAGGTSDLVVLDNLIYGEPKKAF
jgi:hypothetical protein